jgi:uncharacterized protein (DUF302 family)
MPSQEANGIVNVPSSHSVSETVMRLETVLAEKGVKIFALIDHSGEAGLAGMTMRPTKLLIFGSPKAGTPLMLAAPTIAIDLPLKLLVWEDEQGNAWISFNSVEYLRDRHHLPQELTAVITVVATLASNVAK